MVDNQYYFSRDLYMERQESYEKQSGTERPLEQHYDVSSLLAERPVQNVLSECPFIEKHKSEICLGKTFSSAVEKPFLSFGKNTNSPAEDGFNSLVEKPLLNFGKKGNSPAKDDSQKSKTLLTFGKNRKSSNVLLSSTFENEYKNDTVETMPQCSTNLDNISGFW